MNDTIHNCDHRCLLFLLSHRSLLSFTHFVYRLYIIILTQSPFLNLLSFFVAMRSILSCAMIESDMAWHSMGRCSVV